MKTHDGIGNRDGGVSGVWPADGELLRGDNDAQRASGHPLVPRVAAGAALGIAGMGNYFGAGIQSALSGLLVGRDAATGRAYLLGHTFANGYTLDYLAVFWIGMATLSVLCALTVWRAKR